MNWTGLLGRVIDEGIEAARADYAEGDPKLEGSVAGFEACRGLDENGLESLLARAREETRRDRGMIHDDRDEAGINDYWWARCFEMEVEWVCNVVSALQMNAGVRTIITPTARGMMKAASIVGVRGV